MSAILLGSILLAAPAAAQTVLLQDDFNGLVEGVPYTTDFVNWNVRGAGVDVVANGYAGLITCYGDTGLCVDLDGAAGSGPAGPRGLESKLMYSFAAGDIMRFEFAISGNQRGEEFPNALFDDLIVGFRFSNDVAIADPIYEVVGLAESALPLAGVYGPSDPFDLTFQSIPYDSPWITLAIRFQVLGATDIGVSLSSPSADDIGPLIDNVLLTRTAAATTVPEPGTYMLMAAGLVAMVGVRGARRRRS